ncbi:MAG TPA: hypothetical protein PLO51_05600, partial [Candidatus Micrarchaeota archaeon]|nr:hypothetical protein [Candidatus Micrarchaeota archaeon]
RRLHQVTRARKERSLLRLPRNKKTKRIDNMNMKLFFALFITAMLFFGCAQQQPAPPVQQPGTPSAPAANTTPAAPAKPKDTIPPLLTVNVPSGTNASSVAVSGTTEAGAFVTINGAAVDVAADGTFSSTVTLTEGANTIVIVSADSSNNKNTITKSVTYTKPVPPQKLDDTYVPPNGVVTTNEVPLYISVGVTPSSFNATPGRVEFLNVLPGSTSVATMQLSNNENSPVHIEFKVTGDAGNMINPIAPITLFKGGEVRAVQVSMTVPAGTIFGERTGSIILTETRGQAS